MYALKPSEIWLCFNEFYMIDLHHIQSQVNSIYIYSNTSVKSIFILFSQQKVFSPGFIRTLNRTQYGFQEQIYLSNFLHPQLISHTCTELASQISRFFPSFICFGLNCQRMSKFGKKETLLTCLWEVYALNIS